MTPCTGNKDAMIKAGAKLGKNVNIVGDIHYSSEPYLITVGDNTTISFEDNLQQRLVNQRSSDYVLNKYKEIKE